MNQEHYQRIVKIFSDICDVDEAQFSPEKDLFDEIGIDSLDFMDATYEIDKTFGIRLPVAEWMDDIEKERSRPEDFFILENLTNRISELAK